MVEPDLAQDRELLTLPRDAEGRPMAGRIPLERRIGRGGMGAVYYAMHPRLHVPVAVKILPHHLLEEDPSLADRFVSEARIAASLENENIVRVYDVDRDGPTFFLVMAFVDGESAGSLLRARGRLTEPDALALVIAATRGLAAAHARGIIHRDIKPDNILVPHEGGLAAAKLADLGLAKPVGSGKSVGTTANVAMGTPGFMPPEQIDDARSVGPAADVFAMGATLYALLAGAAPFAGSSVAAILRDTGATEPPPLPTGIRAEIRDLVARCLAKAPAGRYADGGELLRALTAIAAPTAPTLVPTPPARRKIPWLPIVAFVGVLALAAGLWRAFAGAEPTHGLVVRWETRASGQRTLEVSTKAADYLVRRLKERGFPFARAAETSAGSVSIRVPGARAEDEAVVRAIGDAETFEFREVGSALEHLRIGVPDGFEEIEPTLDSLPDSVKPKMRVRRDPVITSADVVAASAVLDDRKRWTLEIELAPEAARRFDALAATLFNREPKGLVAILVNSRLKSAPTVQAETFGGRAVIVGLDEEGAKKLARALQGGGLPCPLEWKGAQRYGE